jgi:hypothetical protein
VALTCVTLGPGAARSAHAEGLDAPAGRIILRVEGAIGVRNDGDSAAFDRAQLEAFPQVTVRTETPWTDGVVEFRGPLARAVLHAAGASGTSVQATAINDYTVEIPITDFESHDVILAIARDGEAMRVRDRGPIWVIYPWGEHEELRTEVYHGRSIWQLSTLVVE